MGPKAPDRARGRLASADPATRELSGELIGLLGDPAANPEAFLESAFRFEPLNWLRRMPGRETFACGERVVVKRFCGEEWSEWWRAWTRRSLRRSPARREAENLAALRSLGICVPAMLGWSEELGASRNTARSALAMELLRHDEHLRSALAHSDPAQVRAWTMPLAGMVAKLHREHWFHRDLYLQHFAVLDAGERKLALLDCGRARHAVPVPLRWIVKDLAQLLHSCPGSVGARARWRWLVLYARERSLPSGPALRALARAVQAKELRMRSHTPRHLDPRTAHPDGSER